MSARPEHLNVVLDNEPGRHRVDSPEIGWWLPVLGPTATVLAVTLVGEAREGRTRWETAELARRVGLGGNRSKLWGSLDRLEMFGCGRFAGTDVIVLRAELPELTARQQSCLPDSLAVLYPKVLAAPACPPSRRSVFTAPGCRPTHSPPATAPDTHFEDGYEERTSGEAWS